tara:strand:+ start:369 stop:1241 length:873 start_codon:yes stop_codon:yes gene_type:complete
MKYSVVIPFHNEKNCIQRMTSSLLNQTLPAQEIIYVNDNSSDGSEMILKESIKHLRRVKVYDYRSSEKHLAGKKIVNAFIYGMQKLKLKYEVIVKLDADIILPKEYFEILSIQFKNKKTGIAGGYLYEETNNGKWIKSHPMHKDHIRGAIKSYSRNCFKKIGGLRKSMGWDTVDEILAIYYGFTIKTVSELKVLHLRKTGGRFSHTLGKIQGEAFYKIRYGVLISVLAAVKTFYLNKNLKYFLNVLFGIISANIKRPEFIVNENEGKFIRKYRMNNLKKRVSAFFNIFDL